MQVRINGKSINNLILQISIMMEILRIFPS